MDVRIKLGEHEVLAAGSVIGNPQTPIQIEIENLSITFRFENNDDEATKRER